MRVSFKTLDQDIERSRTALARRESKDTCLIPQGACSKLLSHPPSQVGKAKRLPTLQIILSEIFQ